MSHTPLFLCVHPRAWQTWAVILPSLMLHTRLANMCISASRLTLPGPLARGWKRLHFVLRGNQLIYSRGAEKETSVPKLFHKGGTILLAGCSIGVSAALTASGEQHTLCISHPDRGIKKLMCPTAESLNIWLAALRSAAGTTRAASPHRPRARDRPAEVSAEDTRARLMYTLEELRSSGTYQHDSASDLDDDNEQTSIFSTHVDKATTSVWHNKHEATVNSMVDQLANPDQNRTLSHARLADAKSGDEMMLDTRRLQTLAERDEARSEAASLLQEIQMLRRDKDAAEAHAENLRQYGESKRSRVADDAIAAFEGQGKETVRVSEERQCLQRQVTNLQLLVQDLQADAEARAREFTEAILKLKLEHEKHCAVLVRQSESAAQDLRYDLKVKEGNLDGLSLKLEKSERMRESNSELHADEIFKLKAHLSMAQERQRALNEENKTLNEMVRSTEAKNKVVDNTNTVRPSLAAALEGATMGRRRFTCGSCGEQMFVTDVVCVDREEGQVSGRRGAGNTKNMSSGDAHQLQKLQEENVKLKHALDLALKAEQQARTGRNSQKTAP